MPNNPRDTTDWTALAERFGVLSGPDAESCGSEQARAALEVIIGPDTLCAAVEHCISGAAGAELARAVLSQLHPWCAMQRCHELFLGTVELDTRRRAIELLRIVADRRALPWIAEYLTDPDPQIQFWGAGIVDQLLYSGLIEVEECESILQIMATHSHERIREQYEALMGILSGNE